ncbi:MAG: hypothetical protein ABI167_08460 [Nitrosospira sp.]
MGYFLKNAVGFAMLAGLAVTMSLSGAIHAAGTGNQAGAQGGCFLMMYDGDNFEDTSITIRGAGEWKNLRNVPEASEKDWGGEADSFKVGPNATVQAWKGENFTGESRSYSPGTQQPKADFEFKSLKIRCGPQSK